MKSKKILITFSKTPSGTHAMEERLRTALGISAGYDRHKVDILLAQDAVYFLQSGEMQDKLALFIKSFGFAGSNIYVDEKSLLERKIKIDSIKEPFKAIGAKEALNLLEKSEIAAGL